MGQFARVIVAFGAFAVTTTIAVSPANSAQEKLVLTTGALPPLGSAPGQTGYLERVAREAFRRIGRHIEVITLPPERALANADAGIDDGDLFRAPGFEKDYPNLVQVPETVGTMEFVAYTRRSDIIVRNWADLKPYVVGYVTGWKIFERNVTAAREVTTVRSVESLFPLLRQDRADVVLMDRWQGLWIVRQGAPDIRLIEPPLARIEMFMYLHRKHQAIVPQVSRALAEMKRDGTYQAIFDSVLKPLARK